MKTSQDIGYLILEDEYFCAAALEKMIASLRPGYRLVGSTDCAADCEALLSSSEADLVFSDIMLCDGLAPDALRRARCQKPIVFVTGYESLREQIEGLDVLDFVLKPFSRDDIEASLLKFEALVANLKSNN